MRKIIFILLLHVGQARCQVAQSLDNQKLTSLDTVVAVDWCRVTYLSMGYERDGLEQLAPVQVKKLTNLGDYYISCMLDEFYYFEIIIINFKREYVFTNDNED